MAGFLGESRQSMMSCCAWSDVPSLTSNVLVVRTVGKMDESLGPVLVVDIGGAHVTVCKLATTGTVGNAVDAGLLCCPYGSYETSSDKKGRFELEKHEKCRILCSH